jgi:uncharacterized protein YpmS
VSENFSNAKWKWFVIVVVVVVVVVVMVVVVMVVLIHLLRPVGLKEEQSRDDG